MLEQAGEQQPAAPGRRRRAGQGGSRLHAEHAAQGGSYIGERGRHDPMLRVVPHEIVHGWVHPEREVPDATPAQLGEAGSRLGNERGHILQPGAHVGSGHVIDQIAATVRAIGQVVLFGVHVQAQAMTEFVERGPGMAFVHQADAMPPCGRDAVSAGERAGGHHGDKEVEFLRRGSVVLLDEARQPPREVGLQADRCRARKQPANSVFALVEVVAQVTHDPKVIRR